MEFTLKHNQDTRWTMPAPHFHDRTEILLSLSDGGSFFLMNNMHPLKKGTLLIIRDQILHRSIAEKHEYERYVLHIPISTLKNASTIQTDFCSIFSHSCCVQLNQKDCETVQQLMEACLEKGDGIGDDVLHNCAFLSLLVTLGKLVGIYSHNLITPASFSLPVRQTIDYIDSHLTSPLGLDFLAKNCFVTKYHLCRIFKEETSFTIGEYITQQRLRRASLLLQAGETVQSAGEGAGYLNNSHFIRTFSRHIGMSPGQYRRMHSSHKQKKSL